MGRCRLPADSSEAVEYRMSQHSDCQVCEIDKTVAWHRPQKARSERQQGELFIVGIASQKGDVSEVISDVPVTRLATLQLRPEPDHESPKITQRWLTETRHKARTDKTQHWRRNRVAF